uniref:Uncharacterized protein n=1 Tax=Panagrolaimus superbus TaxID=310955 RepID=A0A914Y1D2_9BILA
MDQSGVVAGDLVHLFQGLGQLAQTDALLAGGSRNLTHQTRNLRHGCQDFLHGLPRMGGVGGTFSTEGLGFGDQLLDFIGRLSRLLSQRTHGRGNHRKAFTGLSGRGPIQLRR